MANMLFSVIHKGCVFLSILLMIIIVNCKGMMEIELSFQGTNSVRNVTWNLHQCYDLNLIKLPNENLVKVDGAGNCFELYQNTACSKNSTRTRIKDSNSDAKQMLADLHLWKSIGPCIFGPGNTGCNRIDHGNIGSYLWNESELCLHLFTDANCKIEKDVGNQLKLELQQLKTTSSSGIPITSEVIKTDSYDICHKPTDDLDCYQFQKGEVGSYKWDHSARCVNLFQDGHCKTEKYTGSKKILITTYRKSEGIRRTFDLPSFESHMENVCDKWGGFSALMKIAGIFLGLVVFITAIVKCFFKRK